MGPTSILTVDAMADILKQIMSVSGTLLALNMAFLAYFSSRSKNVRRKDTGEYVEINARYRRIAQHSERASTLAVSAAFTFTLSLVLALADLIYVHVREVDLIADVAAIVVLLSLLSGISLLVRLAISLNNLLKEPEQEEG